MTSTHALSTSAVGVSSAVEEAQAAAEFADIEIHEVRSAADARTLVGVLDRIWCVAPGRSHLDPGWVVALAHTGNYATFATRNGEPVGAAVGFFGRPIGRNMHSHMVGVLPGRGGLGIGSAIKFHQRGWCMKRGITEMTWTFDPLIARNAYFNVHHLRAAVAAYHVDLYGGMDDSINAGQPSDRLLISWQLDRVARAPYELSPRAGALTVGAAGQPETHPLSPADRTARVDIPVDVEDIRQTAPELAQQWRFALRDKLTDLTLGGWRVADFAKTGSYLLERSDT